MKFGFVLVDNEGKTYRKIASSISGAEKAVIKEHDLSDDAIVSVTRGQSIGS